MLNDALLYLRIIILKVLIVVCFALALISLVFYIQSHREAKSLYLVVILFIILIPLPVVSGAIAFILYYIYSIVKYIKLNIMWNNGNLQIPE